MKMSRNNERFMRYSVLRKILLLLALVTQQVCASAVFDSEPELFVGPAFTSIGKNIEIGVGFGGGLNISLIPFAGGDLEVRGSVMPVFGSDSVNGLIISQIHVPITFALVFLERPADLHGQGLGGAIGLGMMLTAGRYATSSLDLRPCFTMEMTFGVFERGALKLRYSAVVGQQSHSDGRQVSYQSLMIIGSTTW